MHCAELDHLCKYKTELVMEILKKSVTALTGIHCNEKPEHVQITLTLIDSTIYRPSDHPTGTPDTEFEKTKNP